ncbi:sodium:proton antiporter [Pseudomonas qingdaonensis]|uniref:cation:proton antiporter n=1 Tax=Pseudomonas qingdaonensis TaxID=2056231 RepID=UPI00265D96CF|nr:sodium:proton antiporter [Pseudomonas qingdaonensis]WKL66197.1 sodium:proton antiporter [Pseudomonas qingdaonensis]
MNEQEILLAFGGIGVAALGCQWLAWRLKLPAILFLLLSGIMAGPILGWLDPQEMFGPLLMPLVSLAVALILFEGSLTLHLSQWREIGTVVRRMVTLGALSTWVVISAATHWLLGFDWLLAILFGTLTLVTGPTVIVPMLRVVRPKAAVANILRWEGIVIDPIGALLAVVVYSFIIASAAGDGLSQSLLTFAGVILCGSAFGVAGGWLLGQVIRHQWLPEYLHNLASLAAVLGIFIASNQVMHESGLLAWIAPRGIVAAAVSAIFAIRLDEAGHAGALLLVPLTFAVIIGTVVLQSATARPLARLLKVAEPAPSGFLIVGANAPARALGTALQQLGSRVLLADSSWENIRAARMEGLPTYFGHPASQHADAHLDLVGLGHLLGLSPAGELNTLACTRFRHDFGHQRLFVLASGLERQRSDKHRASDEHRGRLFGSQALTYVQLANLFNQGAELYTTHLTEAFGWADYQALHGDRATLLFARDASGWVYVVGPDMALKPAPGWTLVALVQPQAG